VATPNDREDRAIKNAGVVPGSPQDPFYHSTGKTKTVTINGKSYTGIDVGSTKPPAATEIGMVSPSSGLVITGTERNMAKEREAMNLGMTKEYIASRGGINSQGYFNDTPLSGQLSAAEYKSVTKPDGTIDTIGMAKILQDKKRQELKGQGLSDAEIEKKLNEEWGQLYTALGQTGGFDANGNPTPGGQYDSTGKFVGASAPGSSPGAGTDNVSQEKRDAFALVEQTMRSYGFTDVELNEILGYVKGALTNPRIGANQVLIDIRGLNAYKARFKGNEDRRAKGLNVLSEAEYLSQEEDYSATLTQKGLQRFINRAQFATLIGNDISNYELGKRTDYAVQRVEYGNPLVKKQLRDFYNITDTDMVAYYLNPKEVLPELEARTTAAEIGATAASFGFATDRARAEGLRAAGVDLTKARAGYEQIAEYLPRTQELGKFYSQTGINYTQTSAEEEEFKGTASAKRAREQLKQLELGSFSGQSGVARLGRQGMAGTF
jgi:hypothetical protein